MKLTKSTIDDLTYAGDGRSRDVRWDDANPGFGVRVYPSGRKSFVLSYRTNGRKRLLTLGAVGTLTLDKARAAATRERGKIIDGADPVAGRRHASRAETFADLARVYLERHARPNKRPKSVREDERIIDRELLPKWRTRKVADIRRRDVIQVLDAIKDRGAPIQANRVLALMRKMFNFGIERDIIEANPCTQIKMPSKERPRQRVLDDGEIRAVWAAFDDLGPFVGPMFKLRLLTLQRGGEVATMRWSDIDMETGWWTVPAEYAKNGRVHHVPLSAQALALLRELAKLRHASGWVFPSPTKPDKPISNIGKAIDRARAASGVDFVPHDLRRTGATNLTRLRIPRVVVGKLLNHADQSITAVYDRNEYDNEKRHALDLWGRHIEGLLGGASPGNVIELARPA